MRITFMFCLYVALFTVAFGCQATPAVEQKTSPQEPSVEDQRRAFISQTNFPEQFWRLQELEQQALQLAVDEPLKLGSLGSAILDIFPASQTGHYAMREFYAHVESTDAEAQHTEALNRIHAAMQKNADGTPASPFPIMTIYDAHAYVKSQGANPVGAMYQAQSAESFGALLIARPEQGALQHTHFDLSTILKGFKQSQTQPGQPDAESHSNPWAVMRMLATRMDSAALTAVGRYFSQTQKVEDAITWLRAASRSENVIANALLARLYLGQAEASDDDQQRAEFRELALENHLHAIALGSADSMYTLANLYINDYYGEENRAAAIPLLNQAGDLNHAESLLYLGYLYNIGREVEADPVRAAQYYAKAAALENTQAILSYGRFLTAEGDAISSQADHSQVLELLERLAKQGNAEAMVILGNLYARGTAVKISLSKAIRWYKKAVKAAAGEADIINEVVWTLTVSDIEDLKRPKYAKNTMDKLMRDDAVARGRPEYLDTWAATYAATGDFSRAVELQEQAIAQALALDRQDVLDILKGHLELFKAGATIEERAP